MSAITASRLHVALGGLPILKEVTFTVDEGQVVGLLGANGSGKSTLIKALLGLVRHQRGEVSLLGQPLESFSAWNQIGYVPQGGSVSLHSTTVAEVVASGTLARRVVGWVTQQGRKRVAEALEKVGLADRAGELYLHLSAGQKQRVLIARGIVNQPRLVLLDEPFAGVDLSAQAEIANSLSHLEATLVVVLHEVDALADKIDRTLILRDGRLVYDGPATQTRALAVRGVNPPAAAPLMTGMEPRWSI